MKYPIIFPPNRRSRLLCQFHRWQSKRGNMLLLSTIMLSFMIFVFLSVATLSTQLLKSSQSKASNDNISLQESGIIQALRVAYYQQYWVQRINGGMLIAAWFRNADAITALRAVPGLLGSTGIPITDGVSFTLPGNLSVDLTLVTVAEGPYTGGFSVFYPGDGADLFRPIDNNPCNFGPTGSWLGSLQARVYPLPVKIEFKCAYGLANLGELDIIRYRTILFCEIPQKQVALLSEGNVAVAPTGGNDIKGTVRVKGNLDAGLNVANIGTTKASILYGDTATGGATINGGTSITGGGGAAYAADYRYKTEIQNDANGQGTIRSAKMQSMVDPVRIIPLADLCREGLATTQPTPAQSLLYAIAQPFYLVPVNGPGPANNTVGIRIWGAVDPVLGTYTVSDRGGIVGGFGENTLPIGSYPTYKDSLVTARTQTITIAGVSKDYTILEVDPSPFLVPANNGKDLKIFICGYNAPNNYTTFSNCIVALAFVPELQDSPSPGPFTCRLSSFTLITPNDLVFEAAFNYDPTVGYKPVPASYIAHSTSFGFPGNSNQVIYTGSLRSSDSATAVNTVMSSGSGNNNTANVMRGFSFGGITNAAPVTIGLQDLTSITLVPETLKQQQSMSPGEMLYVTLPTQQ
jgi:hypothetical protein